MILITSKVAGKCGTWVCLKNSIPSNNLVIIAMNLVSDSHKVTFLFQWMSVHQWFNVNLIDESFHDTSEEPFQLPRSLF